MRNTTITDPAYSVLRITENGNTKYLLTNRYTDPLFIARRCSIALADKADEGMMHKAFPHAVQLPELLSDCSAAIDFDRSVFSVKEGGRWFGMALQVAATAADWCYERLGGIPPEERMITFYLRMIVEWRRPTVSPSCTPCVPSLRPRKG